MDLAQTDVIGNFLRTLGDYDELPEPTNIEWDASDASESAADASMSHTVPFPQFWPSITLHDLGQLAHRQAITEVWVEYLPEPDCYIKWTRYWVRCDTALFSNRSPSMITDLNYREGDGRREWSRWPQDKSCYELSELKIAAKATLRASRAVHNLIRSRRLAAWAIAAKELAKALH
ncbi:hypothetical protein B0H16DRAFT_114250 [Mycena metata]|uniref:Uncharacterized protein n=1 Tax=Mycena metata TaxID=1033252 RepID=A0AAD7NSL8_9AGAR|nr:hypothetical protein B0H16DRAFT_114250 [Mycena metata]